MDKNKLIIEYLTGKISKEKVDELNFWLDIPENREYFNRISNLWNLEDKEKYEIVHDSSKAWDKFSKETKLNKKSIGFKIMKYAAIITVLLGTTLAVSLLFSTRNSNFVAKTIEVCATNGEKKSITLPDGSEVILNSGSKISYPETFASDIRQVKFYGEGFFNIKKNPKKKFVVETSCSSIEVLGTSFNVYDYPDDENKSTTLLTGKINYKYKNGTREITINPNQQIKYNASTEDLRLEEVAPNNSILWTKNIMYFNNESFYTVKNKIEKQYGIKINCKDISPADNHITGAFRNQDNINEVSATLSKILRRNYVIKKDTIEFK